MQTQENKTKVAFCIPDMIIGGVETVFINLMDELSKKTDLQITIVTLAKIEEPLYVKWLKSHPEIPVFVYYPMRNWFESIIKYKKYRRFIVYKSGKLKDIDVFVDYKHFEFFKELQYFKQPKITWMHSALSYFEQSGLFYRLPLYTKLIGITDDFATDFKEKYPEYKDKIVRIYNPINVHNIKNKANLDKAPTGEYFCHVSRLVDGKDIKTLLDAFDLFAKSYPDVKLYIVGDGYKAKDFQKYAKTLKSEPRIKFIGALNNPYPIMSGAIANILSTEYEGLPTVVLESVALGVPCISSNCKSGPREILLDGQAGLLFNVGDTQQLYEHMVNTYTNNIDKKSMLENMKKSITRFNPKDIAQKVHDIICATAKGL